MFDAARRDSLPRARRLGEHCRVVRGLIGGKVSEMTNIIPFPPSARGRKPAASGGSPSPQADYEFTEAELAALCRWFSAMKYAFPGTEGVMIVSHPEHYSAVGL